MRNWHSLALAAAIGFCPAVSSGYESIYVFGDSLSDDGNTDELVGFFSPVANEPYWQGRFSNGPVWTERLAASLGGNFNNYAHGGAQLGGGATTYGTCPLCISFPNTGFDTGGVETNQYELFYGELAGGYDLSDDLFLVGGGAVNYFSQGETEPTPVGSLIQLITDLYELGAREFMVSNLPDLGVTPEGLDETEGPSSEDLSTYSMNFNTELLLQLGQMANDENFDGISLYLLDLHTFMNNVIDDPAKYGFANATLAAMDQTAITDPADPFWDDYLFLDGEHPTAAAHSLLGTFAQNALAGAPVPEPSVPLLAAAGLAALSINRRRGRATHTTKDS